MNNEDKLRDYLKRATTDLRNARRRIAEMEQRDQEPIAIVAMACRYPGGVRSPEDLWHLLTDGGAHGAANGTAHGAAANGATPQADGGAHGAADGAGDGAYGASDAHGAHGAFEENGAHGAYRAGAAIGAITPFPTDRGWDVEALYDPERAAPGTSYVREGGFLHEAAEFDAEFFGISPREALAMDPQQRLLLETSWEVLERAGIDPTSVAGSDGGVFMGAGHPGYGIFGRTAPEVIEGYGMTGKAASVISGRISYTLGLEGPAVTVDTACSSSLVALHLAVQALRKGECSLALAGGVTVMPTPELFVEFSRQRGLAPDGRCKSFAAAADGTGWSEGVGVLLVERLSDAVRNGHQVLAVVRGSAVNQDGASNGLTAPNGPSQERVIRQALADARLGVGDVDAVEAHGTGTRLGDPIEAHALLATYGQRAAGAEPLWLGSLKSHIGHTQAAAGVGGIIKMVLALRHGLLPRTLHVDAPTPHVDWTAGAVELLTTARPWPARTDPRRAGISSFGVSGTNAHVIIEEPTAPEPQSAQPPSGPSPSAELPPAERTAPAEQPAARPATAGAVGVAEAAGAAGPVPWLLSGKNPTALRAQAARLRAFLADRPEAHPRDVALSLATTRAALDHRAVVIGTDRATLLSGLTALAQSEPAPQTVIGEATDGARNRVFVFPGQGAQWVGMARELRSAEPVFAAELARCGDALAPFVEWDFAAELDGPLERVDVVQPLSWAVMVSLAALWRSYGVEPAAVVGHSQGEIAAAVVAGGLSLEDGARVVALRSKVIGERLAGKGGMVSLGLPRAEAEERIAPYDGRVTVAAVNGASSTVVAGEPAALEELVSGCEAAEIRAKRIPVDYASHTPQVESVRDELLAVLAGVAPRTAAVPFYSTVTAEPIDTAGLDAAYWVTNLRQEVRFGSAVERLVADGFGVFVECSAHPVLSLSIQETAGQVVTVGSLRRGDGGLGRFVASLAEAQVAGVRVDWSPLLAGARPVELPTYAFQRQRYWLDATDTDAAAVVAALPEDEVEERFWAAVEREDLAELATTLGVADGPDGLGSVLPALATWRRQRRADAIADSWRYRVTWQPVATPSSPQLTGTWLLVLPAAGSEAQRADHPAPHAWPDGSHGGWAVGAARALERAGARVVTLTVDPASTDRAALAAALRAATAEVTDLAGVLALTAVDTRTLPGHTALTRGHAATLRLVQALADAAVTAPLWCATEGAVSTDGREPVRGAAQAQVWGLGRVVALEQSRTWGGLIDLPPAVDERALTGLAGCLAGSDGEDQLAVRPAGVRARRLVRAAASAPERNRDGWTPRGTTLVTGGTGALGAHVARWLARAGAEHLLLVSRRGPDAPGAADLVAELTALGTRVTLTACDIADRDALAAVLAGVPAEQPLTAVVHTAAVLDDGMVDGLTDERVERVLRVKARGAENLHALTRDHDLSAFVLFSSFTAVLGTPGLGNYAPGNAHLDALAEVRRAQGLPATAVAWGTWAGSGMAEGEVGERARRHGVFAMDPQAATAALQRALDSGETNAVVIDMRWDRFAVVFTTERPSRLLDGVPEARAALAATAQAPAEAAAPDAFAARLAALPRADAERELTDLIRADAAAVLGHATPTAIEAGRAFRQLGFDSLTAVELRNRLITRTGRKLPATLVFDYPSPAALAAHLAAELAGDGGDGREHRQAVGAARPAGGDDADDPIAIVGMACRFPGGVGSPDELWDLVAAGRDAATPLPAGRGWDVEGLYDPNPDAPGRTYVREGGFLHEAAEFDAEFFGISPREALAMDPQQRLLLETAWEALERAGIDPTALRSTPTGVFTGLTHYDYGTTSPTGAPEGTEGYRMTGNTASVASGRIAYTLGLEGPAVTLDTACSSSLVALHLAGQALRNGECTLALAGGVTVMSTPAAFTEFSRQRGLSADGRCRAFAADADGFGLAEGVGMLLVERLSDARRNGHPVLAVIRGSAVNQDGASNGLTAPNGPSQQRVIRQALANAGVSAAEVDAVEAHGTGTTLGDPIEAQALLATYGQGRAADAPLWLGSVKSNIGHAQAAAGAAGVIKMVQALRHGLLPRTLHVAEPTPQVDWEAGAVALLTEDRPWPATDRPRRAAVSSFGLSGTNAHVVLEQAPEPAPALAPDPSARTEQGGGAASDAPATARPAVDQPAAAHPAGDQPAAGARPLPWLLTAKSAAALRGQAERLRDALAADADLAPADVAHTLAAHRAHFTHRAVAIGTDRTTLTAALTALIEQQPAPTLIQGQTTAHGKSVFVFPGQGAQWVGMARELRSAEPVFAAELARCGAALAPFVEWDFVAELDGPLERVDVVQPLSWAVMVSLAALWRSYGVEPAAVVGHSQGEIAAAVVAGGLSLEDGARVVALRSKVIGERLAGKGGMVSLGLPRAEAEERIAPYDGRVTVAAVNGASSTVVAGEPAALDELVAGCEAAEIRAKRIPVDYASHTPQVESVRDELLRVLAGVAPRTAAVPFYSTVTAEPIDTAGLDAAYWVTNLRQEVRFGSAVERLVADGFGVFVECSAHPVLSLSIQETADPAVPVTTLGSLRRGDGGADRFVASLAEAQVAGVRVDWSPLLAGARPVELPTYAFQRQRYWLEKDAAAGAATEVGRDEVEERFWAAVEREDLAELTDTLGLAEGRDEWGSVLPALSSWRRQRREHSVIDSWRYRAVWRQRAELAQAPAALTGTWLLVVPAAYAAGPLAAELLHALGERGADPVRLVVDTADAQRDKLAARIAEAVGERAALTGVLSLWALDEAPHPAHPGTSAGAIGTLGLLQALTDLGGGQAGDAVPAAAGGFAAAAGASGAPAPDGGPADGADARTGGLAAAGARLWCLTRGAVAATASDRAISPLQAQVWGLGRVAALEQPRLWGGLIDLPGTDAKLLGDAPDTLGAKTLRLLCAALAAGTGSTSNTGTGTATRTPTTAPSPAAEDQLALRDAGALARRMVRTPLADRSPVAAWQPRGTVLVTGGTGGIGGHLARWLADRGAEHLVLTSRTGRAALGAPELEAELRARGAKVTIAACDVADRDALAALVAGLAAAGTPVRAVVHTAAHIELGALADTTAERYAEVCRAKTLGADHLDALFGPDTLDAFVLFSSIAGFWGSGEHGAYAAANAHLDALAEARRARGLPGTAVSWGIWDAANDWDERNTELRTLKNDRSSRHGLPLLDKDLAFTALQQVMDHDETFVAIADVAWDRFLPLFTMARPSPLVDEVPEARRLLAAAEPAAAAPTADADGLRAELAGRSRGEQDHALQELVRAQAAAVLGHAAGADAVDAHRAFRELGFDSLTAVELRNRLATATGLRLPATLVFDFPTPLALAGRLRGELLPEAADGAARPALADLDRLESSLTELAADGATHQQIARRLQDLLWKWNEAAPGAPQGPAAEGTAVAEVAAATADEMFALIDRELGTT
ncbi:type I polyketide synthase [Streptomyces sp. 796.1]|uniref:type I polyketide synthase n=1 Tax=Streptomyces sp. 796.1 TaxID=3163029 RepID=UPI0039C9AF1E